MTRDTFKAKGTPPCELCESLANTNAGSENRGEAALWVNPEQLAAARHDIAQHRMSYVRAWNTDYPPEGATQPLYAHRGEVDDCVIRFGDKEWDYRLHNWCDLQNLVNDALAANPPQAQAGAGDAFLADTWEGLGYTKFNGDRFVMFQRVSDGLQLYCRQEFHEQAALALAALEAT